MKEVRNKLTLSKKIYFDIHLFRLPSIITFVKTQQHYDNYYNLI